MSGPMLTCATSRTRMGVPFIDLDGAAADVVGVLHVAAAANDLFVPAHLDDAAADLLVRRAHRLDDVVHADAVPEQLGRIDVDLVLLHEAADARDLGDARHAAERVAQVPVLDRAQLLQVVLARLVDERVLEDPADAGRVGAEDRD